MSDASLAELFFMSAADSQKIIRRDDAIAAA